MAKSINLSGRIGFHRKWWWNGNGWLRRLRSIPIQKLGNEIGGSWKFSYLRYSSVTHRKPWLRNCIRRTLLWFSSYIGLRFTLENLCIITFPVQSSTQPSLPRSVVVRHLYIGCIARVSQVLTVQDGTGYPEFRAANLLEWLTVDVMWMLAVMAWLVSHGNRRSQIPRFHKRKITQNSMAIRGTYEAMSPMTVESSTLPMVVRVEPVIFSRSKT